MQLPIAPHLHHRHGQLLQGGHRLLGAILLAVTQHGINHHNGHDDHRVAVLPQKNGDKGGEDQDDNHNAGKLLPKNPPTALQPPFNQFVRPMLSQATYRLAVGQPIFLIALQLLYNFLGW